MWPVPSQTPAEGRPLLAPGALRGSTQRHQTIMRCSDTCNHCRRFCGAAAAAATPTPATGY